jgi:hypothetical protein
VGDSSATVGVSWVLDVRLRLIGDAVRYIMRCVFTLGGGENAISVDVSLLVGDGAITVDVSLLVGDSADISDDLRLLSVIYII